MSKELAVFVPVFNGGDLLVETVQSCLESSLPAERYQVLVVDNCSTDGATGEVERRCGARVEVIRNETNLGRIGNWNRCVEIAEARGFTFLNFLFVGDRWIAGEALAAALDRMRDSKAALALAAFEIRNRENRLVRVAQRFSIPGSFFEVTTDQFFEAITGSGVAPIAPLQANLFRVLPEGSLRFNSGDPRSTDIAATIEFLCRTGRPILLCSRPFMAWRRHPGRFFLNDDLAGFIADWTAQLKRLSARTAKPIDWPVANALLILNTALAFRLFVPPRKWFHETRALLRHLAQRGGGLSLGALVRYAGERLFLKRSILRFGEQPEALTRR